MPAVLQIRVSEDLYLKDPEETELGRSIIADSIKLIDKIGFEKFTFKKLAAEIESTEASVYRYFESKHQLLCYLASWYWSWVEYRINYHITNVDDAEKKLKIALQTLTESATDDPASVHVDEAALYRIVVSESTKAYMTPAVKGGGKKQMFGAFESLCDLIAKIIKEIKPRFKYPKALSSALVGITHRQIFYASFIPGIPEIRVKKDNNKEVTAFLEKIALSTLGI